MRVFWNKNTKTGIEEIESIKKKNCPLNPVSVPVSQLCCDDLCCKYDSTKFDFTTTADVETANEIIGQQNALRVIGLGLQIKNNGYNVFVTGLAGTGKKKTIMAKLASIAKTESVPEDICFVYNFKLPGSPRILLFKPGLGKQFKSEIAESVNNIRAFYLCCNKKSNEFSEPESDLLMLINQSFDKIGEKYRSIKGVCEYLNELKDNFQRDVQFDKSSWNQKEKDFFCLPQISSKYEVNLLVDNSETEGAPVIFEKEPSFGNLFGFVKYRMQNDILTADHLSLLPGSVHRARGGYLIIEVEEILGDLRAWNALKKLLRYKETRIESMDGSSGVVPVIDLRPDCIPVSLKVILTGDPAFYQSLYTNDDEFVRLFKVKADLVEQMYKSDEIISGLVSFIAGVCKDEKLKHCDREAVAEIIDYSSRVVEDKKRLSAQFSKIADLVREADIYACEQSSQLINAQHIRKAIEEKERRNCTLQSKIFSLIEDSTVNINTSGCEIGQINSVCIVDTGDYAFGVPSRITVKTYTGTGNIINIEREAEMSGKIHAKGVLILSGYLGQTYAQDKPLALTASICFEQHYEDIDGDSASSAELYCLISSLSSVALRQDIAVTGSVDQRGMVQPVGGVNAKIEGFYKACLIKGLSGTQGIIIPKANIKNLMLCDAVIEAVKKGMFHIYPISTIEQGLQILTDKDPGVVMEDGSFIPGTIHYLVNQKLRDYASIAAIYEKEDDQYI